MVKTRALQLSGVFKQIEVCGIFLWSLSAAFGPDKKNTGRFAFLVNTASRATNVAQWSQAARVRPVCRHKMKVKGFEVNMQH